MQFRGYQDFYSNGPYAQYLLQQSAVGTTTARLLHVSQHKPATCENIGYWADRAPATNASRADFRQSSGPACSHIL